uniref:Uncharacterized protein n=1 Tax=Candidatus Kentrum sp. TUN TaxID=2126343 RepID=A0A451A8I9_9GAMM|nr:MAG: hypothetical protein BECKTUN1418D_GA0071000_11736 [Candidatus Kentron sp. TUN]
MSAISLILFISRSALRMSQISSAVNDAISPRQLTSQGQCLCMVKVRWEIDFPCSENMLALRAKADRGCFLTEHRFFQHFYFSDT